MKKFVKVHSWSYSDKIVTMGLLQLTLKTYGGYILYILIITL